MIILEYVEESGEGTDKLDRRGAALATAGLGALTWALTEWSTGHQATIETWLGLVAGGTLTLLFVLSERQLASGR